MDLNRAIFVNNLLLMAKTSIEDWAENIRLDLGRSILTFKYDGEKYRITGAQVNKFLNELYTNETIDIDVDVEKSLLWSSKHNDYDELDNELINILIQLIIFNEVLYN